MTVVACNFQFKHETLKEILEELHKLKDSGFKQSVFLQLKSGLGTYCGEKYLEAFYKIQSGGLSSGSIQLLTYAGYDTCRQLLKSPPSWDGRSDNRHASHPQCIQKYAEALKKCLPKAFSALYYLYFMCSTECSGIGGGTWSGQKVNGIGSDSGSGLIKRGFSHGELHDSNTGKNVATALKSAVSLTITSDYGSLQNVLCGFMFVCKWDDALTGHACLFLSTFCSKVLEGSESFLQKPYKDHSEAFKDVCSALKSQLEPFIVGSSGLSAVGHGNTKLFDNLWDNDKFEDYVKWLKDNLHSVISSLKAMFLESPGWSTSTIPHGSSAGPFKYGFVFMDNKWNGNIKTVLESPISKLTGPGQGSLDSLKNALQTSSPGSAQRQTAGASESPSGLTAAGAAGGILSLGGAGFGAAYGFNLFGLKDIMSGVFGAIRGLVVGL
ncbi:secreted antigen 1 [Babesia divergens]|uniref:Secreted antigen 1 n=1 Tax=Babesia divergens TaxID=32595 RepID=A0AAD9G5F7_BABDI|nr:secreted antigen 1 [Babesia divergens]